MAALQNERRPRRSASGRVLKIAAVLWVGIAVGVVIGIAFTRGPTPPPAPGVRASLAVGDATVAAFVALRVKTIEWTDAGGAVRRYAVVGGPSENRTLTLVGRTPLELPDEHGVVTLAAVGVANGVATVAWMSSFDPASFGGGPETVDCRVVTVPVALEVGHSTAVRNRP